VKPNELRAAFIQWPDTFRAVILSDEQLALYRLVRKNIELTSAEAADALGISVQSASTRLNVLKKKGYLGRIPRVAASGGTEYAYHTRA
jgi:predicted transcriptional regulator